MGQAVGDALILLSNPLPPRRLIEEANIVAYVLSVADEN
jgi:hypothetical protein